MENVCSARRGTCKWSTTVGDPRWHSWHTQNARAWPRERRVVGSRQMVQLETHRLCRTTEAKPNLAKSGVAASDTDHREKSVAREWVGSVAGSECDRSDQLKLTDDPLRLAGTIVVPMMPSREMNRRTESGGQQYSCLTDRSSPHWQSGPLTDSLARKSGEWTIESVKRWTLLPFKPDRQWPAGGDGRSASVQIAFGGEGKK